MRRVGQIHRGGQMGNVVNPGPTGMNPCSSMYRSPDSYIPGTPDWEAWLNCGTGFVPPSQNSPDGGWMTDPPIGGGGGGGGGELTPTGGGTPWNIPTVTPTTTLPAGTKDSSSVDAETSIWDLKLNTTTVLIGVGAIALLAVILKD